jgi:hypothetical protein
MTAAPASCAPAVKAYLVTLFKGVVDVDANAEDGLVAVSYNEPGNNEPDNVIWVGKVSRTFKPMRLVGSGGQWWGNEIFEVETNISVIHGQLDPQPCEERAWHLIALLETAIRSDPSLGGLVIQANPTTSDVDCEWIEGETGSGGWEATGLLKIAVEAAQ